MHAIIKKAALAAALATASLSAHAVETKISVYADVDPTLALCATMAARCRTWSP